MKPNEYKCFGENCPHCKWYPVLNRGYWGKGNGRVDLIQAIGTVNVGCDDSRHELKSILGKKEGG